MECVDETQTTIAIAVLVVLSIQEEETKQSKMSVIWSKEWLRNRKRISHMRLLKELKENNPNDFWNCLCMPDEYFQQLLKLVSPPLPHGIQFFGHW